MCQWSRAVLSCCVAYVGLLVCLVDRSYAQQAPVWTASVGAAGEREPSEVKWEAPAVAVEAAWAAWAVSAATDFSFEKGLSGGAWGREVEEVDLTVAHTWAAGGPWAATAAVEYTEPMVADGKREFAMMQALAYEQGAWTAEAQAGYRWSDNDPNRWLATVALERAWAPVALTASFDTGLPHNQALWEPIAALGAEVALTPSLALWAEAGHSIQPDADEDEIVGGLGLAMTW